jgi:hypothetical protein
MFLKLNFCTTDDTGHTSLSLHAKMDRELDWPHSAPYMECRKFVCFNTYEILWYHIEKYIRHSKIIFEHSAKVPTDITRDLQKAKDFLQWIAENRYKTETFLQVIVNAERMLTNILPFPNNPSHNSSRVKLQTILETTRYMQQWLIDHPIK